MKNLYVITTTVGFSTLRLSAIAPSLVLGLAVLLGQANAQTGSKVTETEKAYLMKVHNDARREVGNEPLTWDNNLAREAQAYAEYLASTGLFKHAKHVPGWKRPLGENLGMTWNRDAENNCVQRANDGWYGEKADFVAYRTNGQLLKSHFGKPKQVGHYTQMVWQGSTKVGAGKAKYTAGKRANKGWVVVAKYSPRGNITNRYAYGKENTGASYERMRKEDLEWLQKLAGDSPDQATDPVAKAIAKTPPPTSTPVAKPVFTVKDFSATCSGNNVRVSFNYESNLTFADKSRNENLVWQITPFTADGKQDPFNSYFRGGFKSGEQLEQRTFDGHPRAPGMEMKPGAYLELQYATLHTDGTATVGKVIKRAVLTGMVPCVRVDDVAGTDATPPLVKDTDKLAQGGPGSTGTGASGPGSTGTGPTGTGGSGSTGRTTPPTTSRTSPISSSPASDEPFEVLLLMGNSATESYHVTLERNGTKIGEYHLAGTDELWDGAHTRAITHPAFFEKEFRAWKSVTTAMTLRKFGKTKPGAYTRIRTGARFGDVLKVKQIGSSEPEKTWQVKTLNATGSHTIKLMSGKDLTVSEMTFNTKTDLPRPPQQRRRRVRTQP